MPLAKLAGTFSADGDSEAVNLRGLFNVSLSGTFGGGTVRIQRNFQDGAGWKTVSKDKDGSPAAYTAAAELVGEEPEDGVLYRLNLQGATNPSLAYRVSQ